MKDYTKVAEALKSGADPEMLCKTCPWDRYCINPPDMTQSEVDELIAMADGDKDDRDGGPGSNILKGLMARSMVGDRATAAQVCPVFALRLQTSEGETIVKGIKAYQQGCGTNVVAA